MVPFNVSDKRKTSTRDYILTYFLQVSRANVPLDFQYYVKNFKIYLPWWNNEKVTTKIFHDRGMYTPMTHISGGHFSPGSQIWKIRLVVSHLGHFFAKDFHPEILPISVNFAG